MSHVNCGTLFALAEFVVIILLNADYCVRICSKLLADVGKSGLIDIFIGKAGLRRSRSSGKICHTVAYASHKIAAEGSIIAAVSRPVAVEAESVGVLKIAVSCLAVACGNVNPVHIAADENGRICIAKVCGEFLCIFELCDMIIVGIEAETKVVLEELIHRIYYALLAVTGEEDLCSVSNDGNAVSRKSFACGGNLFGLTVGLTDADLVFVYLALAGDRKLGAGSFFNVSDK